MAVISERTEIEDTSKDTQIHSKDLYNPNVIDPKKKLIQSNLKNKSNVMKYEEDLDDNLDLETRFTMTIETKYEYMYEQDDDIKNIKAKATFNRVFEETEQGAEVT